MEIIWQILWFLALFVHYGLLPFGVAIIIIRSKGDRKKTALICALALLMMPILFNGCPLTHIENYCAYKATGVLNHYEFRDSIAYQILEMIFFWK